MLGTKATLLLTAGVLAGGVTAFQYDAIMFGDPILCGRFALPRAAPVLDGVTFQVRFSSEIGPMEVRACPHDSYGFRIRDEKATVTEAGYLMEFVLPKGAQIPMVLNGEDHVVHRVGSESYACHSIHRSREWIESATTCRHLPALTPATSSRTPLALEPGQPWLWIGGGAGLLVAALVLRPRLATAVVPAVFAYSRVLGPKVLDQGVRAQIHQAVAADPGLHASEIMRRVEAPWSTTAYHLRVLERERVLMVRSRHYFPAGSGPPSELDRVLALRDPGARRVYDALQVRAGSSNLSQVAQATGLSVSGASKAIRRLERVGLARREKHGRHLHVMRTSVAARPT